MALNSNLPLPKTPRPCPDCGGTTYNASRPGSTIRYDHCYKCQVTWGSDKKEAP